MNIRTIWVLMLLILLLSAAWLCHALFGQSVADSLADHFGAKLLRAADGKFNAPAAFIQGRLREILWLTTCMAAVVTTVAWLYRRLPRESKRVGTPIKEESPSHDHTHASSAGLRLAAALFIAANLLAWTAGGTVVFWALFYDSIHIDNFAQYHIKKILYQESKTPRRAVVIGNSQANRAIDEVRLNNIIGNTIWTTELTQPGSRGFDLLTISRDIPLRSGDTLVCYVSEISFYGANSGNAVADFMHFRDLPTLLSLGGYQWITPGAVRSGILGRLIPLYRYHNSIAKHVLGHSITNLNQQAFEENLQKDLDTQAAEWAPKLKPGSPSRFELESFSILIREALAKDCRVILIAGHLHPALASRIDPAVTRDFDQFLTELRSSHGPALTILPRDHFGSPSAADFDDLVHFTNPAQAHYTDQIAVLLKELAR